MANLQQGPDRSGKVWRRQSPLSPVIGVLFAAVSHASAAQDSAPAAGSNVPPAETSPAPAAGSGSIDVGGIPEIVVTAQKRAENEQKVPLAINALDSDELQARGISGVGDLGGGAVPALRMEPFSGNPSQMEIAIRGFANGNGNDISQENGVPVYIDDVYNGRQQGTALDLTEIERIEVLRGPQGTLFGKNAAGGAIRIVSKAPSGVFGIRENAEGGNFGYWKTDTHIDLPRIGDVASKIDLLARDGGSWVSNPAPGEQDFGRFRATGGRLALRYQPVQRLTVDYAGDYTHSQVTAAPPQLLASNDPYQIWPVQRDRQSRAYFPTALSLSNDTYSGNRLNANLDVSDALTLRSITAYRVQNNHDPNYALTASAFPYGKNNYLTTPVSTYDIHYSQFSQELQLVGTLDNVQWVNGLFFMRERGNQLLNTTFGTSFPGTVQNANGTPSQLGTPTANDPPVSLGSPPSGALVNNISAGAFAQATWRPDLLQHKLALTGGLRLGLDEKQADRQVGYIYPSAYAAAPSQACGNSANPPVGSAAGSAPLPPCTPVAITERRLTPLAVLAYDWTRDLSTYLRYSSGYRAAAVSLSSRTFLPVQADSIETYELGQKSEFFHHRLRANAALFHERWKDPQLGVQTVNSSTVELFNGPTETIDGMEVDTSVMPFEDLTVNLSGTYYRGKRPPAANPYTPPGSGGVQVLSHFIELPAATGSLSVLWDIAHTRYGIWRANLDATTTSGYWTVANTPIEDGGYTLLNARLSLAEMRIGSAGGKLDLTLWSRNLLDRDYRVFVYSSPGIAPGTQNTQGVFGEPRTFGAAAVYRY